MKKLYKPDNLLGDECNKKIEETLDFQLNVEHSGKSWMGDGKKLRNIGIVVTVIGFIYSFMTFSSHEDFMHSYAVIIFSTAFLLFTLAMFSRINQQNRIIAKFGKDHFSNIVFQTAELCKIRRYFNLFPHSFDDTKNPFEFWYESVVCHYHLIPGTFYTGKIVKYWDKNKKNLKYGVEFKNGNEYGLWKAWYKNGQIAYEQNFKITEHTKSGVRHGKARCWNKKGEVIVDLNYIDGKVSFEK